MSTAIVIRPQGELLTVPAIVAAAGDGAARRFLEFFTATIRNRNPAGLCPCRVPLLRLVRSPRPRQRPGMSDQGRRNLHRDVLPPDIVLEVGNSFSGSSSRGSSSVAASENSP